MKGCYEVETLQLEITNHCINSCSNCSRFCGHHYEPYFMDFEYFKYAVDCSCDSPNFLGFMGGEPLLHPDFEKMCEYVQDRKPREKLALWSTLPKGYEKYADVICETFGNILINDHSKYIYHAPILVQSQELIRDRKDLFIVTNHCWLQEHWSSSINPKGAFFCEIAASLSILLGGSDGWPVEPGWWKRVPKDFKEQIEEFCPQCGIPIDFERRVSSDGRDDISPEMVEKLRGKSRKVDTGKYVVSNMRVVENPSPLGKYKDREFREKIAKRYGIVLLPNQKGYLRPIKL